MRQIKIKQISLCALFTAVIAGTAWISVPTPFGVNLTLQIFGIALVGFYLKTKYALIATAAYVLIGAAGMPIFSNFSGGIWVVLGPSGGFLWGFLFTAVLCGAASTKNKSALKYLLMILSVLLCHATGVIQFCIVSGVNIWAGILSTSLPFLIKDFVLVFLAEITAKKLKKIIK